MWRIYGWTLKSLRAREYQGLQARPLGGWLTGKIQAMGKFAWTIDPWIFPKAGFFPIKPLPECLM
jgi:hypothetical protein